jgi:V/A-type H+-transporting ATPase subunit F
MKLAALCDNDTAVGLRLAGIKDVYVPNGNVRDLWTQLAEKDDLGIIFITESIAEQIGKVLNDYRLRYSIPIIIEIPDKSGRRKDHVDYVSKLIKKAVGVEVSK